MAQAFRVALLITIVLLVRQQHVRVRAARAETKGPPIAVADVRAAFPAAARLGDFAEQHGGRTILDEQDRPIGVALQTSPDADGIVGYSGPSNVLILLDDDETIVAVRLLSSDDTPEHVADCVADGRFWKQFAGLTWEEAADLEDVDAVSGATLTSLAILQGVRKRLGGDPPSLLFPQPLTVEEAIPFFPAAQRLEVDPRFPNLSWVLSRSGDKLGRLTRTSPAGNHIMGYEGPTDTLVALDLQDRVVGLAIRSSMDNQREVGWVRDEAYFMTLFNERSLQSLADMDIDAEQIEGVSGATMTSRAIALALREAAAAAILEPPVEAPQAWWSDVHWSVRDTGTVTVIVAACLLGFSRFRGHRWLRRLFLAVMVVYLGFINGDVLSQALLVGWSKNGVPWQVAPGLVLLTAAAFLLPITSGRQIYCSHVCPFGAAQQLVRSRLPWQLKVGRKWQRRLKGMPFVLLVIVVLVAKGHLGFNLAGLEPFDAFAFRVAGAATLAIAGVGLVSSLFVPMAYCRYGCPTGQVLDYARLNRHSGRWGKRDWAAVILVAIAIW